MKGQIFSIDLLLSVSIFLGVMAVGIVVLDDMTTQQTRFSDQYQLQQRATQIADLFVRTDGHPSNWDSSSVQVIGFAQRSHVMNTTKFHSFAELEDQEDIVSTLQLQPWSFFMDIQHNGSIFSLNDTAGAGGFGHEPVAYIAESSDSFQDVKMLQVLNESSVTWDLYWPSTQNQQQLDALTARNIYTMTSDGAMMTDRMLGNVSSGEYETVIAEDINIDTSDIENESYLREHVETGGTFLHTESNPTFIQNLFNLTAAGGEDEVGEVAKMSPILNQSLAVGDTVEFDDAQAAFADPSTVFINDTNAPYGCLACHWSVEDGDLYYLADSFQSTNTSMSFTNGTEAIDLGLLLSFGDHPGDDALDIAVSRRSILLDTNNGVERGRIRVMVWR